MPVWWLSSLETKSHAIWFVTLLKHSSSFAQGFSVLTALFLLLCWDFFLYLSRLSNVLGLVTTIFHYYKEMWSSFLEPDLHYCKLISVLHGTNRMGWLLTQQRPSMNVVWEMFPQHVTSWKSTNQWPTYPPDLSVCDHFLCGPLKVKCIPQEEILYQVLGYLWDRLEQSLRNAGLWLFEK